MIRKLNVIVVISLLSIQLYSQGFELYGGYPLRLVPSSSSGKAENLVNWNAGLNCTVYIRSVAIQFGVGYSTSNYKVNYDYTSPGNDAIKGIVKNAYISLPFMVYPKIFADGNNVLSVGAGANFMFPIQKPIANVYYEDGSARRATLNNYKFMPLPRISVRYTRFIRQSFLFFADLYTDISVIDSYVSESPGHGPVSPIPIPNYYSQASIGVNVGIGYILPIDGVKRPRYFLEKEKKTKS